MKIKLFYGFIILLFITSIIMENNTYIKYKDQVLKDEASLISYLGERYPGEEFEIIGLEEKTVNNSLCGSKTKRNNWTVKSKTTGITFEAYDQYIFNSYNCGYEADTNYNRGALAELKLNNEDERVGYTQLGVKFEQKEFTDDNELAQVIYETITKINKMSPFKYEGNYIYVHIYRDNAPNITLSSKKINSSEYILKELSDNV